MLNVLVTRPFGEPLLNRLRAVSPDVTVTQADPKTADYNAVDVLYADVPPRELARMPRLKWAQLHLAGVNALHNHPIFTDSAIPLTTTSGVHAFGVAEYAFTAMLALAHRVPRMVEWKDKGTWPPDSERWPLFLPAELRGATLGIIGYGSIGRELARLAKGAFAMKVLVTKRDPAVRADDGYYQPGTGDPEGSLPDEWFGPGGLRQLLSRSDVVVMAAPLTAETERMLGPAEFAAMKPNATFVNVGRGATVDESALHEALAAHRIAGAAIDVYEEEPYPAGGPLYQLDNVILSPHVSGFVPNFDEKCCALFAENLRRFLAGEALLNLVDREKGY